MQKQSKRLDRVVTTEIVAEIKASFLESYFTLFLLVMLCIVLQGSGSKKKGAASRSSFLIKVFVFAHLLANMYALFPGPAQLWLYSGSPCIFRSSVLCWFEGFAFLFRKQSLDSSHESFYCA